MTVGLKCIIDILVSCKMSSGTGRSLRSEAHRRVDADSTEMATDSDNANITSYTHSSMVFDYRLEAICEELIRRADPDLEALLDGIFTYLVRPVIAMLEPAQRLDFIHRHFVASLVHYTSQRLPHDSANSSATVNAHGYPYVAYDARENDRTHSLHILEQDRRESNRGFAGDMWKTSSLIADEELYLESAIVFPPFQFPHHPLNTSIDVSFALSPNRRPSVVLLNGSDTDKGVLQPMYIGSNETCTRQVEQATLPDIMSLLPSPDSTASLFVHLPTPTYEQYTQMPTSSSRLSYASILFAQSPISRKNSSAQIVIPLPHSKRLSRVKHRLSSKIRNLVRSLSDRVIRPGNDRNRNRDSDADHAHTALPFRPTKQNSMKRALSEASYHVRRLRFGWGGPLQG